MPKSASSPTPAATLAVIMAVTLAGTMAVLAGAGVAQTGGQQLGGISRPSAGMAASKVAGAQSPWARTNHAAVRLIAGAEPAGTGGRRIVAGVEFQLAEGWKTYWRHPGDDGGLPPTFDWSGSRNLQTARVLYPAPERIRSLNGTTLGYARAVVFPVEIVAADPTRPVGLVLSLEYGICREICIPVEARLELTLDPGLAAMPSEIATSLAKVPRPLEGAAAAQVLRSATAMLKGPAPALTFDIATLAAGGRPDLFVEAPGGAWLPVPAKVGEPAGGVQRFRIDLKGVDDIAALAGKPLRLTVSGAGPGSELTWMVK